MSIDFNVHLNRVFSAGDLSQAHREVLAELVGETPEPMRYRFWEQSDDFSTGPGLEADFERVLCGPGLPSRWMTAAMGTDLLVDLSIISSNSHDSDLEAIASFRTPESVVGAIAGVIAGQRVGQGEFDPNVDRIFGTSTDPISLVERLRIVHPEGSDFGSRCRLLLGQTSEYRDWPGLRQA